jgi:hypothetical protein
VIGYGKSNQKIQVRDFCVYGRSALCQRTVDTLAGRQRARLLWLFLVTKRETGQAVKGMCDRWQGFAATYRHALLNESPGYGWSHKLARFCAYTRERRKGDWLVSASHNPSSFLFTSFAIFTEGNDIKPNDVTPLSDVCPLNLDGNQRHLTYRACSSGP